VVGPHGHLETVRRLLAGHREAAGVVQQHVQAVVLSLEVGGEPADVGQAGQVQLQQLDAVVARAGDDLLPHRLGPGPIPASHDDAGAHPGQLAGGLQADAAVGSGDEYGLVVHAGATSCCAPRIVYGSR